MSEAATATPKATPTSAAPARANTRPQNDRRGSGAGGQRRNERGPRRQRREREPRQRSEFENKIIGIRRVTRVVAGGRRFSFSVTIVIGNGKGKVGVGLGKATDTALAIEKATRDAQRNLLIVPMTDENSIPHETQAKCAAAQVLLMPAPGKGLKAGSAVRTVLELAGVRNVSGKILTRSKNPLNNARATVLALSKLTVRKKRAPAKEVKAERATPVSASKTK